MNLEKMLACRPSPRQLAWQAMEYYGFIHFTVNTFTGAEWGDGSEDPRIFAPSSLDCRQWARAAREGGMSGLILTAKHHDGFCLWPSRYSRHTVAQSGYPGDVVAEFTAACRAEGLKAGLYLSPWDRHEKTYGSGKAYDDYYCAQLEELTTQYGELFCIWLDGACGEGENGKKQAYDWERYYAVVRKNQPQACLCVSGPDVRWCGNEAGRGRESEFSVVSAAQNGYRGDKTLPDLGSRKALGEGDVVWYPAEVDTSIRPGWFYHEEEAPRSLEDLTQVYLNSAGANACLLLNLPPDRRGLLPEADVARLKELGQVIARLKGGVVASAMAEARFPASRITHVTLREDIAQGQRVEAAYVQARIDGQWRTVAHSTAIGYQRILPFTPVVADGVRLRIAATRARPQLMPFTVHSAP